MAKAKKATVTVNVECPCCKSELKVDVFKKRIGPVEPAEYEVTTDVEVEKQGQLFKGKQR